ncbi:MAG TPA: M4 family metallopeptidase [Holophagaceae bacterium]|nr:M4 family metallopeptidase [Holophagaceae bacterium]
MSRSRLGTLSLLSLALVSATLPAEQPLPRADARVGSALQSLATAKAGMGLGADDAFAFRAGHTDELGQTHVSFQQTYQGVPVWGGQVIAHADKGGNALAPTKALYPGIRLNVTPSLASAEALATAQRELAPKGPYASDPKAELVVFPVLTQVHARPGSDATAYEYQPVRYALAFHVSTDLQNGTGETKQMHYMIDAHTGAILAKWNGLETSGATGTGNSQYSGTVNIATNYTGSTYELRDTTRGNTIVAGGTVAGNAVTNLNHATDPRHGSAPVGTIYTDSDNTWGDGANYVEGSSTTAANGETAAVDAAYGIQATWDMYKNVLGRNGIDNTGKSSYLRVHYSNSYDNAFWSDTCFCMTFGDGSSFLTLTSVDVAGHEMSHGVCANNGLGGLNYSGESGGLNESNSDIMGTMVEFYDLGGGEAAASTTVPATGGNWTIGEQLETPSFPTPLRYMYKPSLDGSSPDAWYSGMGTALDVHYSSGPGNRMFYFLSQGATASGDTSAATYLPNGMTGVGNDEATRIHYRALTTYYSPSMTYADARTAHISAATDLYGATSFETYAVENAFHGINVGSAAPTTAVKATLSTPSADQTVSSGDSVSFSGTAIDTIPSTAISYGWNFGDGSTGSGASASHVFTNATGSDVVYTVTFTATDANSATASSTRNITVHSAAVVDTTAPTVSGAVAGSGGKLQFTATASDNVGVTQVEFYVDGVIKARDLSAPYGTYFMSTGLTDGAHTLEVRAYDAAGNIGTSGPIAFSTDNTAPTASGSVTGSGGIIRFDATAADSIGVTKVQFLVDGVIKAADTTAPYSSYFNSTTLTDGSHTLEVKAFDAAGNAGSSGPIAFSTDNTAPASVSGSVTGTSGTVHFDASATDNVGVAKIEFFVDGVLKASDSSAPFGTYFNTTALSNGSHTLVVKAYDAAGNSASSSDIPFSVSN